MFIIDRREVFFRFCMKFSGSDCCLAGLVSDRLKLFYVAGPLKTKLRYYFHPRLRQSLGQSLHRPLSVFFLHDISKRLIQLGSPNLTQKCSTMSLVVAIYFGVRRSKVKVTSHQNCRCESLHFCDCSLITAPTVKGYTNTFLS